jgi:type I restriction enzyme, S subunit
MALGLRPIEIVNSGKHPMLAIHPSWDRVYLKEVATVQNGYAFKSSNFSKRDGFPLIRIRDICKNKTDVNYIGEFNDDYIVSEGDILIGMDGDFNCCEWQGSNGLLNQRVCRVIINSKLFSKKFLFYVLPSYLNAINQETSSVTVKHLSSKTIGEIPLPSPPLPEQHRIVEKIEELFSELDNGVAALNKAKEQLKVYRQSVLKWAFEGSWENTNIGALFNFKGGGTPSKNKPEYWNGNINWASVKDVKGDYLIDTKDTITELGLKNSSATIAHIDDVILVTRISVGKAIISSITTAINQDLKIVVPQFKTSAKYISYLFKSIERDCIKVASGTTVLGINLTNLKDIRVPLIEFDEQNRIVIEIESRLSVADNLEKTINENLLKTEALRQSILKSAFEGRLV